MVYSALVGGWFSSQLYSFASNLIGSWLPSNRSSLLLVSPERNWHIHLVGRRWEEMGREGHRIVRRG